MGRDLVIIEAPGKLRTFRRLCEGVGLQADICATIGHVLEAPKDLRDLGIALRGGEYVETNRRPIREDSFRYLCDCLARCKGRVLIATDNDQEGHVIAADVISLMEATGCRQPAYRLVLNGLTHDALVKGLAQLSPVDIGLANAGVARRIADRLIGGGLSDFSTGRTVGRVQTALLSIAEHGLPHSLVGLSMPCSDGGEPFRAILPITGVATPAELIAQLDALPAREVAVATPERLSEPGNYGDTLLSLNAAAGLSISQAADLLQELYEAGDISYPRTSSRAFSDATVEVLEALAKVRGIRAFRKAAVPIIQSNGVAHEAIHVLNSELLQRLDLGRPPALQGSLREAALAIIAKQSLESGLVVARERPNLEGLPEFVRSLDWRRDARRPMLPWRPAHSVATKGGALGLDAALVQQMMKHGVGRPSTWPSHAARFAERGFVDDAFQLTTKGLRVLEAAPHGLRDVLCTARIEDLLQERGSGVSSMVNHALQVALEGDAELAAQLISQLDVLQDDQEEEHEHCHRPVF
ncbi:DNA topoisomerase [Pseudomonas nitroreducens]|uniref:DNA topoisomerase n=1 Tax=Pseudomonas nitroreducens TaxID=46680 RepID=UPI002659D1E4|nr:toprim domain-containing protein [Pseudomonas nitroreducens]MCP1652267.1 DNA topoisomerase-1 [Pseudomonas nitroreducens]MCP1689777.1 DNA topoisomerase-1 [Pseudomonas nitroreducens]